MDIEKKYLDSKSLATLIGKIKDKADEKVARPISAVHGRIAVFDDTTGSGKAIKDSGYTIAKSVPANAVFTDTNHYPTTFTWSNGTSSAGPTGSLTGPGMSAVSFGAIPSATTGRYGVVKLSNSINNSSDSEAATAGAVNTAYQSLSASIEANKLTAATDTTLGGVKIGSNISVSSGTISLTKSNVTSALGYTPPTTNTTYGLANFESNGLMSATTFATMSEDSAISNLTNISFETDPLGDKVSVYAKQGVTYVYYTRGENDYIESGVVGTIDIPAATTTKAGVMSAADKTKLDGIATGANKYTLPNATSSTLGGVKIGSNISVDNNGVISLTESNVTTALGYTPPTTNTTYSVATIEADGLMPKEVVDNMRTTALIDVEDATGTVTPAPNKVRVSIETTIQDKNYITGAIDKDSFITSFDIPQATTTKAGVMSAADKSKLDSLSTSTGSMNISGTVNLTNGTFNTQNNTSLNSYTKVFEDMSVGEMRMYLVADSSGNLPSTTETAVTVPYNGVLSPAQVYFGKSAAFGVSVGDICVLFKRSSIFNICRIIPLNDVKPANGDFPGADGLSTVWDKTRINKVDGIEWTANHVRDTYLPKNDRFPSRADWLINVDNCIDNGVYPTCDAVGMNLGLVNNYVTLIVHRTSTADNGGYHTIEQTAYGRGADEGQIYKRIIFVKYNDSTQYGDWKRVDNNYNIATTEGDGLMSKTTAEAFNDYGAITYLYDTEADVTSNNDGVNVHWNMFVDRTNYLTGESTADDAPSYVDFTIPLATDASAGVMSAADKIKLNGMGNPLKYICIVWTKSNVYLNFSKDSEYATHVGVINVEELIDILKNNSWEFADDLVMQEEIRTNYPNGTSFIWKKGNEIYEILHDILNYGTNDYWDNIDSALRPHTGNADVIFIPYESSIGGFKNEFNIYIPEPSEYPGKLIEIHLPDTSTKTEITVNTTYGTEVISYNKPSYRTAYVKTFSETGSFIISPMYNADKNGFNENSIYENTYTAISDGITKFYSDGVYWIVLY